MSIPIFKDWASVPIDFNGKFLLPDSLSDSDGPLVEMWVKPGKIRHREDGFAIIHQNGLQYWMTNDKVHRLDGPAVICYGKKQFWIYDHCYSEYQFWKHPLVIEFMLNKLLGL